MRGTGYIHNDIQLSCDGDHLKLFYAVYITLFCAAGKDQSDQYELEKLA
jgi:hypothetical protein